MPWVLKGDIGAFEKHNSLLHVEYYKATPFGLTLELFLNNASVIGSRRLCVQGQVNDLQPITMVTLQYSVTCVVQALC